ncbi:MAG: hypothetical protein Q9182_001092 [Xanthomendoza sp. 2 TL-2023]
MPPSTGTRRSSRKRSADTRALADRKIIDSSPSRMAKRKKNNATGARRNHQPSTPEFESAEDDNNVTEDDAAESQAIADKIIPYLDVAKVPVVAATQYVNVNRSDTVQAYAKLCGREWTYYVQSVPLVIGRPPDTVSRPGSCLGQESSPGPRDDSATVHIDLGPSKMVSRLHAKLEYKNDQDIGWHVEVKGRNGVKVNDRLLRRGQESLLQCGDVLDIAGTQMMFITANEKANIHAMFLDRMDMAFNDEESIRVDPHSHAHPETVYAQARASPQPRNRATSVTPSQSSRKAATVPAPPNLTRAVTPIRSPNKQPRTSSAVKQSPTFKRGYVIESSEQIDFTSDSTKDLKPTIPYSVMITQAILSTPDQHMTLSKIYEFIMANFAYYRHLKSNWQVREDRVGCNNKKITVNSLQNSIRHNLSLHTGFEKVPRGPHEPGKGMKWRLVESKRHEMIQAVAKHMKKSNARPPSLPASPVVQRDEPTAARYSPAPTQQHSSETNGVIKTSPPAGPSPTLTAFPMVQESYTPVRGSHNTTLANHDHTHGLPALSDDVSPLPIRPNNNIRAGLTDSSPVLTSGIFDGAIMTPAPRQYNLNSLQPNTIKMPTSHMTYSSPAPFWKQPGDSFLGSTPMRFPEISPIKATGNHHDFESSSPPPAAMANNGNESPTRGRGAKFMTSMKEESVDDEEDEGAIDLVKYVFFVPQFCDAVLGEEEPNEVFAEDSSRLGNIIISSVLRRRRRLGILHVYDLTEDTPGGVLLTLYFPLYVMTKKRAGVLF